MPVSLALTHDRPIKAILKRRDGCKQYRESRSLRSRNCRWHWRRHKNGCMFKDAESVESAGISRPKLALRPFHGDATSTSFRRRFQCVPRWKS